jgi:hypothetical protein
MTMTGKTGIISNQRTRTYFSIPASQRDLAEARKAKDNLIAEGGVTFFNYIRKLGLERDPGIVVISSHRHFYYDADDMNKVKTLVNLTELNQIKRIVDFLQTCYQIMPQGSNLIGCFVDNSKIPRYKLRNNSASNLVRRDFVALENGIVSNVPFINRLYSIFDSKTNTHMTKSSVSFLLEGYGFKVLDMTELDGLTYFQTQKARPAYYFAVRAY